MTEKQYYQEQRVSSSSLKWFEQSPLYFKKMIEGEIKQIQLKWFDLGRQVHMAILEPELFEQSYITMSYKIPTSANQKQFCENYMINGYDTVEAYKFAYTIKNKSDKKIEEDAAKVFSTLEDYINYLVKSKDYRDILSESKWDLIHNLKSSALSHKKASSLLINDKEAEMKSEIEYFNEYVIFWEYPNGVKCKSMLDRFVIDHKKKEITLVDVKTSFDVGGFSEHFMHFKYYRQLAFYWMAIHHEFKDKIKDFDEYKKITEIVAVQTKDIPLCRVFRITDGLLKYGLEEIELLMKDLKWHYKENSWEHSREYHLGDGSEKIDIIHE